MQRTIVTGLVGALILCALAPDASQRGECARVVVPVYDFDAGVWHVELNPGDVTGIHRGISTIDGHPTLSLETTWDWFGLSVAGLDEDELREVLACARFVVGPSTPELSYPQPPPKYEREEQEPCPEGTMGGGQSTTYSYADGAGALVDGAWVSSSGSCMSTTCTCGQREVPCATDCRALRRWEPDAEDLSDDAPPKRRAPVYSVPPMLDRARWGWP